eukprot:13423558-Alexandrium_andersonii.AAC.1
MSILEVVTLPSGQRELAAQNPARVARGPSTPNGPNGSLHGSASAKVGDPLASLPGAGGVALR